MSRADRVVAQLEERELDCLLVTNLVNVRYLTGFTGTNGACVVGRDGRLFLTDSRYVEQSKQQTAEVQKQDGATIDLYIRDAVWPSVALKKLVRSKVTVIYAYWDLVIGPRPAAGPLVAIGVDPPG